MFSLVRCLGIGFGIATVFTPGRAALADTDWTGGTSQNWNDATNWDNGVPTVAANNGAAIINTATGNYPIYSAAVGTSQTAYDIIVANGDTTARRLDQTGGSLFTGTGSWFFVGNGGSSTGTYNLANTAATGGTYSGFGQGSGSLNVGGANTATAGRFILGNGDTSQGTLNMNTTGTLSANDGTVGFLIGTNGGSGTVNLDSGTINISQAWFGDNNTASTGTLKMSGGTFNTTSDFILGRAGGTGTVNMSGGTINSGNEVWVGEATNATTGATGVATVGNAGTISAATWFVVGRSGNAGSSGTLTLNGGNINVKTGGANGNLEVAVYDASSGTVNINGNSKVNLQNSANIILGSQNTSGDGTINQNGGNVTFYADGGVTVGGTGAQTLGGGTSSGTYFYNLNGGVLTVPAVNTTTTSGGISAFNFNGGTITPTASTPTFMQGLTAAFVSSGGALINTNRFNITIGQSLQNSIVATGVAAMDGGLTKNGAGMLTLTAVSTFNGATKVNAGTLLLAAGASTTGAVLYRSAARAP